MEGRIMKTRLSKIVFLIVTACFFVFTQDVYAKNLFVSTGGSDSVAYASNDISHPWLTWNKATLNAMAGDIVYFRGGTYSISSEIVMKNGHIGTSSNPITYKNYPGEKVITNITSDRGFLWDAQYNQIEADTYGNMEFNGRKWIFYVGYDVDGSGFSIKKCKLYVSTREDNGACICLQSGRSTATIEYNEIVGPGINASWSNGIIYLGGGNTGTKIRNNVIHECGAGVYIKHANSDTNTANAEIGYNYFYNCTDGVTGNPRYINIHDNIVNGGGIYLGNNGGGAQGNHNLINHNTVGHNINFEWPSEGPIAYCTITNNICAAYGGTGQNNTYDYNIYKNTAAIGTHDLHATPIYEGGTTPSTIAGFALTSTSIGYRKASDSKDLGANVNMVGFSTQAAQAVDTTPPSQPAGIKVNIKP
jgi:hypothetical protein